MNININLNCLQIIQYYKYVCTETGGIRNDDPILFKLVFIARLNILARNGWVLIGRILWYPYVNANCIWRRTGIMSMFGSESPHYNHIQDNMEDMLS